MPELFTSAESWKQFKQPQLKNRSAKCDILT